MSYADLPTNLGVNAGPPLILMMEATGIDQDEQATAQFVLSAADVHSPIARRLRQRQDQMPVQTFERWLRVRLAEATTAIRPRTLDHMQFWLPNYDPAEGWELRIGTAATYRPPTSEYSDLATHTPPTAAPGLPLGLASGPGGWLTDWIVLQASWYYDAGIYVLQPVELQVQLSWQEHTLG